MCVSVLSRVLLGFSIRLLKLSDTVHSVFEFNAVYCVQRRECKRIVVRMQSRIFPDNRRTVSNLRCYVPNLLGFWFVSMFKLLH